MSRELIARAGSSGSLLVIDRRGKSDREERLLAHLPSDEPFENALIVTHRYLESAPLSRRCRVVSEADARTAPLTESADALEAFDLASAEAIAGREALYRLERCRGGMAIDELRWRRYPRRGNGSGAEVVSLREAIAQIESYEPLRTVTKAALERHERDPRVSVTILRAELERVLASSIVLNRGLREAVLAKLEQEGLSMSEIAIRCGRIKRDSNGNASGETSWLARRLGLLAEGGKDNTTPWIHSDVLALIARSGIGVSPREVELG